MNHFRIEKQHPTKFGENRDRSKYNVMSMLLIRVLILNSDNLL